MKVGFIGLGIMGHSMAMNLIKNNYELTVYNRTKSKAEALIKAGAKWADNSRRSSKRCGHIIYHAWRSDSSTRNSIRRKRVSIISKEKFFVGGLQYC